MSLKRGSHLSVVLLLTLGIMFAIAISLLLILIALEPPLGDLQQLFVFMSGSGGASLLLVFVLYRTGALMSFKSLRWTLLASLVLLVLLIIANVWFTAQLMFISHHDFTLTMALLIFAGLVALISVFLIANTWIERIRALEQIAEQVAQGNFDARLHIQGQDELAHLSHRFNQMVDALATLDSEKRQLEQMRRDFIAWVSHDLRTPLASVRAMNEAMLDGIVTDEQTVAHYGHTIQRELAHLSTMIEDLFAITQMDAGNFKLTRETTSLRDLVSDTLMSMKAKAAQVGITLEGTIESGIDLVTIAPNKIQRVLYNLLDNALRHTPTGQHVHLTVSRQQGVVTISVHNTGTVIPKDELPHLFTSFYRGERSRVQWKSGERSTGLGLAIVRGFVEAHGGHIEVTSSLEQGTCFTFTLPQV